MMISPQIIFNVFCWQKGQNCRSLRFLNLYCQRRVGFNKFISYGNIQLNIRKKCIFFKNKRSPISILELLEVDIHFVSEQSVDISEYQRSDYQKTTLKLQEEITKSKNNIKRIVAFGEYKK